MRYVARLIPRPADRNLVLQVRPSQIRTGALRALISNTVGNKHILTNGRLFRNRYILFTHRFLYNDKSSTTGRASTPASSMTTVRVIPVTLSGLPDKAADNEVHANNADGMGRVLKSGGNVVLNRIRDLTSSSQVATVTGHPRDNRLLVYGNRFFLRIRSLFRFLCTALPRGGTMSNTA